MKKIAIATAWLSVGVNIYYYGLWTYVFYSNDVHEDRLSKFSSLLPLVPSAWNILILAALSLFSVIIFGIYNFKKRALTTTVIIFQALAMILFTWQLM